MTRNCNIFFALLTSIFSLFSDAKRTENGYRLTFDIEEKYKGEWNDKQLVLGFADLYKDTFTIGQKTDENDIEALESLYTVGGTYVLPMRRAESRFSDSDVFSLICGVSFSADRFTDTELHGEKLSEWITAAGFTADVDGMIKAMRQAMSGNPDRVEAVGKCRFEEPRDVIGFSEYVFSVKIGGDADPIINSSDEVQITYIEIGKVYKGADTIYMPAGVGTLMLPKGLLKEGDECIVAVMRNGSYHSTSYYLTSEKCIFDMDFEDEIAALTVE